MSRYVVTGANGFIARHLLRHLRKGGDGVLPISRSFGDTKDESIPLKDVSANVILDKGFGEACIVHLIGPNGDEDIKETLVETTKVMCDLGQKIKATRFIYLSGFGVSRQSTNLFFRSKLQAEEAIRQSGIPFTILRCSYIFGRGDELTPNLLSELLKGRVEIPGDGYYRIQPLYVDDVVAIVRNAGQQRSDECQSIDLLGEIVTYFDFVNGLAKRVSSDADISPQPVEIFMREAVLENDPRFSLTELAILLLDLVGERTEECFGVTPKGTDLLLDILTSPAT